MAHNLNIKPNGQAAFVSKQELPWHKLGTIVDTMNSKEAMELGGLDFEVEKRPLYVNGTAMTFDEAKQYSRVQRKIVRDVETQQLKSEYSRLIKFQDKFSIVRTDNSYPLGIVGSKYTPVQNIEAFNFFDDIAKDGIAEYETAGALGNGEVVFITAKVTNSMTIHNDQIDKYLLISLSHDGSSAITVAYTPIRVVCNNTLTIALKNNASKVSIRHTASAHAKLDAAKATLGLISYGDSTHMEYFNRLLDINISEGEVIELFANAYKLDTNNLSTKGKNILETNLDYYYNGLGQKEFVGTGWGAFNAVTGYLQNVKTYTNDDTKYKAILQSNQQLIRDNVTKALLPSW
jgi:phage/plasmid-like protein (TIGR03299 family)